MRIVLQVTLVVLLTAAAAPAPGLAQQATVTRAKASSLNYPVKALRFVVGLAPGGATDIVARLVAQKLSEELGQSVVVDNRSGAAGSIAASIVVKSQPDGYTMLVVSSSYSINPSLYELPFDPVKDFAPVAEIAQAPFLLVVTPSLPAQTVKDLIALAKARPKNLRFSSGGKGGSGHMAGELFKRLSNIEIEHVPYRGGSPALVGVMSNEVQFTFSAIVAGLQQLKTGKLRALGVTSARRSTAAPDVPTIAEAGVPGYEIMTWYGILAPAGTSKGIISRLNEAVRKVVHMPDLMQRLLTDGAEPVGYAPMQFGSHLESEINKWKIVTKGAEFGVDGK